MLALFHNTLYLLFFIRRQIGGLFIILNGWHGIRLDLTVADEGNDGEREGENGDESGDDRTRLDGAKGIITVSLGRYQDVLHREGLGVAGDKERRLRRDKDDVEDIEGALLIGDQSEESDQSVQNQDEEQYGGHDAQRTSLRLREISEKGNLTKGVLINTLIIVRKPCRSALEAGGFYLIHIGSGIIDRNPRRHHQEEQNQRNQ